MKNKTFIQFGDKQVNLSEILCANIRTPTEDELDSFERISNGESVIISKNLLGDIRRITRQCSNEIAKIVAQKNKYDLNIPIGTLLGSEYTTGYGPKIKFKMQNLKTDNKRKSNNVGLMAMLSYIYEERKVAIISNEKMSQCPDADRLDT